MSMDLMVAAMKMRVGNPLRKLVLIKLADNASDQGECWPSYQHIADQCEISKRSVMSHIAALCDAGLLRKETRKGGSKGNSSNVYYLTLGGSESAAPPLVQEIHQGSAGDSPPSESAALGGSAGDSPRTNHSLEPVNEPVIEPIAPRACAPDASNSVVPSAHQQPRCDIPADMPGPKDQTCKTFKAWANYAMAYRKRYGQWPVWNGKVAGQLGQVIERLGAEEAPRVVAYYLNVNDARVVQDLHGLGRLLQNAESYRTQWATNRQMTGQTARQIENTQTNLNSAQEAADLLRSKEARNAFL